MTERRSTDVRPEYNNGRHDGQCDDAESASQANGVSIWLESLQKYKRNTCGLCTYGIILFKMQIKIKSTSEVARCTTAVTPLVVLRRQCGFGLLIARVVDIAIEHVWVMKTREWIALHPFVFDDVNEARVFTTWGNRWKKN